MRRSLTVVIGTIGGLLTLASVVIDGRITADELGRIGAVLCVSAVVAGMWRKASRPQQALYELGFHDGEASTARYAADERKKGYREGRRIARPVALPPLAAVDSRDDDRAASSNSA